MATKSNQIIFLEGKEKALKNLFQNTFKYLAIGYDQQDSGFEDDYDSDATTKGFSELTIGEGGYHRVGLSLGDSYQDPDTGKMLVKFQATLDSDNIQGHRINQMAIVDDETSVDTTYFSATTFPAFNKTENSSITFVIGMRV